MVQERTLEMESSDKENKPATNPYAPTAKPAIPTKLISEKLIPSDADMEVKPQNGADPTIMIKKAPFYRGFGRRVKTQPKMSKPVWPTPFDQMRDQKRRRLKSEIKSEHETSSSMDIDEPRVKVPKPPKLERDSDEEREWLRNTNGFLFPPKGYKPVKVDRRRKYPKDPEWKPGT